MWQKCNSLGLYGVFFTYNRKPKMDDNVAEMWQDSGQMWQDSGSKGQGTGGSYNPKSQKWPFYAKVVRPICFSKVKFFKSVL